MFTPVVKDPNGREWVWDGTVWIWVGPKGGTDRPKYFPTKKDARKVIAGRTSERGWSVWFMTPEEYERYRVGKAIQT